MYLREYFTVDYTPEFTVNLKIIYNKKVLLDTLVTGYYKNKDLLIYIPIALPKYKRLDTINSDIINRTLKMPPDSLRQIVTLQEL